MNALLEQLFGTVGRRESTVPLLSDLSPLFVDSMVLYLEGLFDRPREFSGLIGLSSHLSLAR